MPSLKRSLDRSPTAQATMMSCWNPGITALLCRDEHPAVRVSHSALCTGIAVAVLAVQPLPLPRLRGSGSGMRDAVTRRRPDPHVPRGRAEPEAGAMARSRTSLSACGSC